ncbi:MAG: hypothetical protein Ct9H90mP22_7820 [Gammaproteobacteria bacterium]|nr:MAG: hypothetical protein Ct9H90mP22_7820 [Gammaproteobacteria bacterium]
MGKENKDFLTGFLEEMEEVPSAGPGSQRAKEGAEAAESSDEETHLARHERSSEKDDESEKTI